MTLLKDSATPHLTLTEQASTPDAPGTGAVKLYALTDGTLAFLDDADVEHVLASTGGGIDATNVTYTPFANTDWDSDTDPGDVNDALDQLAERVDDLESLGFVSTVYGQTVFTREGTVVAEAGNLEIENRLGRTVTVDGVYLRAKTAPTGADLVVDIHAAGTTLFATQSNRPKIAAGNTTGNSTTLDDTSWGSGEALTADVDQVGSTAAGANLVIVVAWHY
jgi:hypothetical protein